MLELVTNTFHIGSRPLGAQRLGNCKNQVT